MCIYCNAAIIDDGKGEWVHKRSNRYECDGRKGTFASGGMQEKAVQ